ncbi:MULTISPECIES: FAD-dependent oxidoreductase [Priestia]|uniref:FAD-dependent oxidoreductase n=1 Tax=Priestia TaxID=2800373 RepID=UPI0028913BAC|nr:FAD-dependent oxidoreductase [Priestia flexa]MDT2047128.1 FAD-dependent oxidoreductase [Priestia flexa]
MNVNREVVVIGGGIGGLTAAALLTKVGFSVTVLEASREWGGCAGKFNRGKYTFPVGATLGMGFEQGGVHERILRFLGLDVEVQKLSTVMDVHFPHRTLTYYQNRQAHIAYLQKEFKGYESNIMSFYKEVEQIALEVRKLMAHLPILPPKTFAEWRKLVAALEFSSLRLIPHFPQTFSALLKKHGLQGEKDFVHFIDGQLIDSMQTTSASCSLVLACLALDIYHEGAFYVKGGLYQVAEVLQMYIEDYGGKTLKGREAVRIERKDNRWIIHDHRNNAYDAFHVVCNVPIQNLSTILDKDVYMKLTPKLRAKAKLPQWGTFTMYLAIKEEDLPSNLSLFQQILLSEQGVMTEGEHIFVSISHPNDERRAPQGYRTITASTHIDLSKWQTREAYDQRKKIMEKKMIAGIKTLIPHIERAIHQISGAPMAWERFTSRAHGGVGGFPQTLEHALFNSLSHRSGINGLWLCGDTIFPGAGTIGASVSGYHVFQSITEHKYTI